MVKLPDQFDLTDDHVPILFSDKHFSQFPESQLPLIPAAYVPHPNKQKKLIVGSMKCLRQEFKEKTNKNK